MPNLVRLPVPARRLVVAVLLAAALAPLAAGASAPPATVPDRLDLRTAIGFALENNFAIRQARERIRQQEGISLEVRSRQVPNVAAAGSYQRASSELSAAFPPSNTAWTLDLTASQTVFAGGGVRAAVRGSEESRQAALLDLRDTIDQSLLAVRTNFYAVLLARERIKVQEQNVALLEEQHKTATERFNAGSVSQFEQLRASVAVDNARVPLISARNEFRLAIENLRLSLGFTANTAESVNRVPEFVGTLEFTPTPPTTWDFGRGGPSTDLSQPAGLAAAFAAVRASRPDLLRLNRLVAAQEQAVTAARAGRLPTVALAGGWQARGAGTGFGGSQDGVFLGLRAQWNVFDGRATSGRILQAHSAAEQLRLQATQAALAAEVEVRSAASDMQEATELAQVSARVVGQAEEALRLALARYAAGSATQLDTLQAQLELTTARMNQLQAYYGHSVAVARMGRALGFPDPFYVE